MSKGQTIPYHLRQNKAIDRNLFIDLLMRIGRYRNISDYEYIGFGGAFLEDFKALHGALRIRRMKSLESSAEVVKRQEFNKPLSCIEPVQMTSDEFLDAHDFVDPSIVWFDYTAPRELALQLGELELLGRKANAGDVLRVTLNASPESLGRPASSDADLKEHRLDKARERMTVYCPASASPDDVSSAKYPALLLRCVESALKKGMDTKPGTIVEPLSAFTYADGQQMLTVTVIILQKVDLSKFYAESRLKSWPFRCDEWSLAKPISVPQLSAKERMFIEALLPSEMNPSSITERLGYYVGDSRAEAEQLLANFVQYYRLYPWYSRVVI